MKARQAWLALLLWGAGFGAFGQVPHVGDMVPDFALFQVEHSKYRTITQETFKGKWQFIYFWSLGCGTSVVDLVKMDSIQSRFLHVLQVIPIGRNHFEINEGIDEVFDQLRENRKLRLLAAYDSALFYRWKVEAVPHIVVVDPEGIVRFVTAGFDMSIEKVEDLINGRSVTFAPINNDGGTGRTILPDTFRERLSSESVEYAAILTGWKGEDLSFGYEFDRFSGFPDEYQKAGWVATKISLERLYQYAYFGQCFWYPADTALYGNVFRVPEVRVKDRGTFDYDYLIGKGLYNCYLKLPLNQITEERLKEELKRILAVNFGYKVSFEVCEMPVWKLVAGSKAQQKLETQGGTAAFLGYNPIKDVIVRNYSVRKFLFLVVSNLPNPGQFPYIDATGINYRIDATIKTDMTSFEAVQKELGKYGLELQKGLKPMKVMVISD